VIEHDLLVGAAGDRAGEDHLLAALIGEALDGEAGVMAVEDEDGVHGERLAGDDDELDRGAGARDGRLKRSVDERRRDDVGAGVCSGSLRRSTWAGSRSRTGSRSAGEGRWRRRWG
jgi:hypothetical protein